MSQVFGKDTAKTMFVSEDNTEKDANDPVAKAVSQVSVKVAAAKTVSVSHIS